LSVTPGPIGTSFIHVVVAGDTLGGIAARYGVTDDAIAEANGLKSKDQVFVGQRLIIPAPRATSTPLAGPTGRTHVVKSGETLTLIAGRYGVSVAAIMKANNIANADQIYAGQVLIIPD
jgi:peptidoglycan-N-acetylglucosamine deacetylase